MHTLFVLRHGETEWNVAGRMQGRLDSPLTPRGRVQAARQGAILRHLGFDGPALVSPLGRARSSARLAGLDATPDTRLVEITMGGWEGKDREGIGRPTGVLWKFGAPGAETVASLQSRLESLLTGITVPTVVVTHGVVCIALRALLTGQDIPGWDRLDDPQGVVIRLGEGVATVLG
ncbi:MAG: histidine phosphatase family protein [Jannaschia sp.]